MVTFHLREKDWNELKSNSCMWIASNDHVRIPFIKKEKVFLGSESVEAVEQVDPEEKFGLFAVQTFEVESSSDCEILKVRFGYQYWCENCYLLLTALCERTRIHSSTTKQNRPQIK